jgi:hypothetical protein
MGLSTQAYRTYTFFTMGQTFYQSFYASSPATDPSMALAGMRGAVGVGYVANQHAGSLTVTTSRPNSITAAEPKGFTATLSATLSGPRYDHIWNFVQLSGPFTYKHGPCCPALLTGLYLAYALYVRDIRISPRPSVRFLSSPYSALGKRSVYILFGVKFFEPP